MRNIHIIRDTVAAAALAVVALACSTTRELNANPEDTMTQRRKLQVTALLDSIESGDSSAASVINPSKYVQHNLAVADGLAGFGAVLAQLPQGSARVAVARVLADGDFVFTHTEYDFFGPKIGFDVFRFEGEQIVEHWDNLQETPAAPNPSGHTMIDGVREAVDRDRTEANKAKVRAFVEDVLVNGRGERIGDYLSSQEYIQHNPQVADGISGLNAALAAMAQAGVALKYDRIHKVLGEGSLVLVMSEGRFGGRHTAFYDLFRVANGLIVEHWDVISEIPPREEWKNDNGKF